MCEEFSKRLTAIRKDRKISQKQAAADMGVSQALLSHYEKGVRECGLNFVIKAAQYYNVSADYLLDLSPVTNGATVDTLPDPTEQGFKVKGSLASSLAKKMVYNGIELVYACADKMGDKDLSASLNDYMFLSVYNAFRTLYDANPKNSPDFFMTDKVTAPYLTRAKLEKAMAKLTASAVEVGKNAPELGQGIIERDFPDRAGGLLNLIKNAEKGMEK